MQSNKALEVTSATIITTEPNEVAGKIHNRMPVILPPEDYETWQSPDTPASDATALLRPYQGHMIAYPVPKAVGSPKNDSPDLIEPVQA